MFDIVQRLISELSYWIHIGIANDIVDSKYHRLEYIHLVEKVKDRGAPDRRVPRLVLFLLKKESERVWFRQHTFWHVLILKIKRKVQG